VPPTGQWDKRSQRADFVKTGSTRKTFAKFGTLGAATVVVAGFMSSPVSAFATAAPMTHISNTYAHVGVAPRLPAGARTLGAVSASKSISGAVALSPRDPAALQRAAAAVSNPRSKSFHSYIAKGSFAAMYGPTTATINAVKATLAASHLSVTSVSSNGLLVRFKGSVGSAESAFRTNIANVRLASGRTGTETTSAVSFPSSIASQVVSVVGLNTLGAQQTHVLRPTHPATVKPTLHTFVHPSGSASPCAAATGAATEFGGLTDDQIAHAYGADGLYSAGDFGAGQTVAIYELEPFALSDIQSFDTCYFGATKAASMIANVSSHVVDGGPGTGPGSGESALDIENVSAVAPGAHIEVYLAPNGVAGPLDLYNQIVQDDSAKVVSTSWGECELTTQTAEPGYLNVENELFEQAALQGQSVFASSGDSGSDDCAEDASNPVAPRLSVDDPGSQPFVTSVGGTTITNDSDTPTEHTWNDGNMFGGAGGGVSQIWGAPSWQQPFLDTAAAAAGVTSGDLTACQNSPSDASMCRQVPDVSAQADEFTSAITIFVSAFGGWTTIGGTSSSAPLWAAMTADINASSGCTASGGVGFASPSLYAVAAIPADYAASFNDLKTGDGNNDVYDLHSGTTYATHTGYDMASGLGTPQLTGPTGQAGLASFMCALSAPTATPRPVISSLSTPTVLQSASGPLTITGTGFTGATGLSIGSYDVPAANWSVTNDTTIAITVIPTAALALTGGHGPQDGSGRALVSVTGATGATSLPNAANASLLYVDTSATSPVPSVSGVVSFGGAQAGGNTVSVFGSDFTTAAGPNAITGVTVGGRPATALHVVNPNELTITVPAFTGATVCPVADDTVNDVCQAQVVVTNGNGSSATVPTHVPYTGAPFEGLTGAATLPACVGGNTCEVVPSSTEYDYYPTPTITSVVTTDPSDSTVWASEQGDTIATINGKGFDSLGFLWTIDGNPTLNANQDFATLNLTPTSIQVLINGREASHEAVAADLTVATLAGNSAPATFDWAGVPSVSSVSPPVSPVTGGATITVTGRGFVGAMPIDGGSVQFQSLGEFGGVSTMNSGYTLTDTSLTGTTSSNNPGATLLTVCTITFCSEPTSESSFENAIVDFYQAGDPVITSVSRRTGPASGGTAVVIRGVNLSDATEVDFGSRAAEGGSAPGILTNGSSTEVDAIAPPGVAGSKVNIRVTTVESLAAGHTSAVTPVGTYTYKASVPSAPQDVKGTAHGKSIAVTWKAPLSAGGHAITHYRVSAVAFPNSDKRGAKKPPAVTVNTKHGTARSATLAGLRAGWFYEVRVQAVNSLGRGLTGLSERVFFIHDPA
jgi:Pro-kumamolisin, activation domain/Fibronectin type III domain/IPT/TIG domain